MNQEKTPLLYDKSQPTQENYAPPPHPTAPPSYTGDYQQQPRPQFAYQPPQPLPYRQEQPLGAAPPPPVQVGFVNTAKITFGDVPMQLRCPTCQKDVITTIRYEPGLLTWVSMLVMVLLGFLLCCWVPLLIDALKDVVHSCPNCHHKCGTYKRIDF